MLKHITTNQKKQKHT